MLNDKGIIVVDFFVLCHFVSRSCVLCMVVLVGIMEMRKWSKCPCIKFEQTCGNYRNFLEHELLLIIVENLCGE